MTTEEAIKLALEALENVTNYVYNNLSSDYPTGVDINSKEFMAADKTITAIKEALAQPEQEPVVWMMPDGKTVNKWGLQFYSNVVGTPLYTSPPPQHKPLTLGQKQRLWSSVGDKPTLKDRVNAYGLAIEAAHGIGGEA